MISGFSLGRRLAAAGVLAFVVSSAPVALAQDKGEPASAGSAKAVGKKKKNAAAKSKKAPKKKAAAQSDDDNPYQPRAAQKKDKAADKGKGKSKGKAKGKPGGGTQKVVVLPFKGPYGGRAHGYVAQGLKGIDAVGEVGDVKSERENSADAAAALGREQSASAVVYGTMSKSRGALVLELTVRSGTNGEVLGETTVRAPNLQKLKTKIAGAVPDEFGGVIADAKAPEQKPEAEPAPKAEPEEETKAEAEKEPEPGEEAHAEAETKAEGKLTTAGSTARGTPLELLFGARVFVRNLSYNDDLHDFSSAVREQSTYSGPGVSAFLSGRWYPLAHTQGGTLSNIGLIAGYERGFFTKAKPPQGAELDVTYQEFFAGLRARIPIQRHELGISAAWGQHQFTVEKDEVLLPDMKYSYLRPGVDTRFRAGSFLFGFSLGYRHVLSAGQVTESSWFPHADVAAIDAGLFGGYTLSRSVDLLAGADLRRYFYTMNSEPGDAHVAGGALDQYWSGWAGVMWHLPVKK